MSEQERIVCAAIRFAIPKEDYTGVKIVIGVDYESIVNDGVLGYLTHGEMTNIWQNGFITNKNRFVDPIEAQKIAITCGQYQDPHTQIRLLEESIEIGWHSLERARTGVLKHTMRNEIAKDQKRLDELKAGYLGYALRVEDLHYVSS